MMPDYSNSWFVKKLGAGETWSIVYVADTQRDAEAFATYLRLKGSVVLVEGPRTEEATDAEQDEAIRDYNEGHT